MGGPILRDGLFVDGLAYTNIAKNMAQGIGGIWRPLLEPAGPVFYGHPTLALWLESRFFTVFGNHLWTEDLYNTTVLALTLFFSYLLWGQASGERGRGLFWFFILLFALNQENQLRYPNAMLECSLTVFALGTTYAFFLLKRSVWWSTLACGIGAFACFLIKGPVGLFPLGLPFLYRLIVDGEFSLARAALPPIFCALAFGGLFAFSPPAYDHLATYWGVQVIAALDGRLTEHVPGTRFKIIFSLVESSVLPLMLCALVLVAQSAIRRTASTPEDIGGAPETRKAYFLLTAGLSAILPIMISTKQASYYQVPSLPFIYLGLTMLLIPKLIRVVGYLSGRPWARRLNYGMAALVVAGLLYASSFYGTTDKRDTQNIAYAAQIAGALGDNSFRLKVSGTKAHLRASYANAVPAYLKSLPRRVRRRQ